MICQFARIINSFPQEFWVISLEEMYAALLYAVRSRRSRFFIPSSERYSEADGYILWGTYERKRIIDIRRVARENGKWGYEEVEIEDFHIQRIREKETGATHAVLNEFFVPYKQYSLRYILFHLRRFFKEHVTQEAYCLDVGIEVKAFQQWLKWLKKHLILLFGFGLTESYRDNWEAMRQWIREITGDISSWTYKSLRKLNLALFQDHEMPENTEYHNYERPG